MEKPMSDSFPDLWQANSWAQLNPRPQLRQLASTAASALVPWLKPFFAPDQVLELRILGYQRGTGRPHVESGYFSTQSLVNLCKAALLHSPTARGVYFTLNPLKPELLARRTNRVDWAQDGELTKDQDVLQRRWLLIDADPIRDSKISATDDEKARAEELIRGIKDHLSKEGWPRPILADSGNGYHLFYRVDLPTNDGQQVAHILKALEQRFTTDHVHIDTGVHNPARICKVPGTWARKGDPLLERPHRVARILEVPSPC
jgi:hypothetical protein